MNGTEIEFEKIMHEMEMYDKIMEKCRQINYLIKSDCSPFTAEQIADVQERLHDIGYILRGEEGE